MSIAIGLATLAASAGLLAGSVFKVFFDKPPPGVGKIVGGDGNGNIILAEDVPDDRGGGGGLRKRAVVGASVADFPIGTFWTLEAKNGRPVRPYWSPWRIGIGVALLGLFLGLMLLLARQLWWSAGATNENTPQGPPSSAANRWMSHGDVPSPFSTTTRENKRLLGELPFFGPSASASGGRVSSSTRPWS